ncbi:uncharacterized protein LOC124491876 [Dermatophagoides farinae]|uniref:uncharacterized protein LOC124491876 n=1 Tax=Dermatophagoides farinae TaxID=6954 RepID=UPI003F5D889C
MSGIKMFSMLTTTTWAVILMASLWFWSGPFRCYCYSAKYDNNNDQDLNIYHHDEKDVRIKSAVISKWSDVQKIVSSQAFQNDDDRIEINIFLLILNPNARNHHHQQKRMSKHRNSKKRKLGGHDHHHQNDDDNNNDKYQKQYSDEQKEIITQFQYSATHFHSVTSKYNLIKDNDVGQKKIFRFIIIDNDDDDENGLQKQHKKMLNYLRQHSTINERTIIDQWQRERDPFMLVKLSNHHHVQIMKNYVHPHAIMMVFWYGKVCRLPLLKYSETSQNQISDMINMTILFVSMISLIFGQRKNLPYLQQLTSLPALLYPIGFVWNQIHGSSSNGGQSHSSFLSIIQFSPRSNGQFLSESLFIMAANFTFSYCLYMCTDWFSNPIEKLKPDASNKFNSGKVIGHNSKNKKSLITYLIIIMAISFWIVNSVFKMKLGQ